MEDVNDHLVVPPTVGELLRRLLDRTPAVGIDRVQRDVRAHGSELQQGVRADEVARRGEPTDRKVLLRAERLDPVIDGIGDLPRAQRILLGTSSRHGR
jgi:hypothetical protein